MWQEHLPWEDSNCFAEGKKKTGLSAAYSVASESCEAAPSSSFSWIIDVFFLWHLENTFKKIQKDKIVYFVSSCAQMGSPQHTSSSQKLAVATESEDQHPAHIAQLSTWELRAAGSSHSPSRGVHSVGGLGLQDFPNPLKMEVPETQETFSKCLLCKSVLGRGKQHGHFGFQESHFEHSV